MADQRRGLRCGRTGGQRGGQMGVQAAVTTGPSGVMCVARPPQRWSARCHRCGRPSRCVPCRRRTPRRQPSPRHRPGRPSRHGRARRPAWCRRHPWRQQCQQRRPPSRRGARCQHRWCARRATMPIPGRAVAAKPDATNRAGPTVAASTATSAPTAADAMLRCGGQRPCARGCVMPRRWPLTSAARVSSPPTRWPASADARRPAGGCGPAETACRPAGHPPRRPAGRAPAPRPRHWPRWRTAP